MVHSRGQTFVVFCLLILQVIASTSSISDFNLEFSEGLEVKTSDTEQLTINSNSFVNDNCPYFLTMSEALDQGCANQVEECSDRLTPAEVVALRCTEAGASSLLESHSLGVQRAFRLSSDLTKYTSEELLETKNWFVVTNLDESVHVYQFEGPDKIRPTLHDGFYIWSYEEPSIAKESLEEMYKSGLIEGFHPLIDMQAIPEFTPNDPLFANQWHLVNTAQIGGSAVAGEDVNITSVWDDYDGTGIIISIVDDGINSSHPDLSTNWNSVVSYDWCNSDSDPSHTITNEYHGTAVAGVAAATGNNNIDVTGAAFGATISAQKIMGSPCNSGWTVGDVLGFSNTIIDIYQNSWGYSTPYLKSVTTPVESGIESSITNGRGGLGSIIVFSAGNDLTKGSNSNNGDLPNSRYTIAVSAITDSGEQSPYSEPGTNILLAAYSNGGQIGILTTDPTGTNGKLGMNSTNGNFGGTSSAAPLVSGIIALMLEANENLTWRDVQHILVNSAKKNDANDSSWIINGAGHDVSEKYGFGAIDAGAAVNKALNWQSVDIEDTSSYGPFTTVKTIADPTSLCQTTVYSTSNDSDGDWYEDEECTFNLPSGETLELDLRLPDEYANEVGVKLTGPSGTQTIWQPGDFVNTNTSLPMQSQNNTLLNARLINLGSYTTSGTYTLQIYDSYGDGCPGYSAFTYQISCEIFATYGSDWTESTVTISGGINNLETVELEVDIDHTNRSNLDIVLVSPSGTESWLAKKYHDGNGENDLNWKFSSVHHWDEYSDGTWTLKIRDVVSGDTGTLNSWSLNIYGTNNSQNSCLAGTYQPTGQSSCIDASAGYYVDTSGSTMQTACAAGTYQPSTGQSSCIDASAGYYVSNPGSTNQTACSPGTYNPYTASINSTSCISTSAGYFANVGSANQTACAVGTYQPSTGQSSCIDASTGYYVSNSGSTNQTACGVGTYQPSPGQSSCMDSSPGYYVPNIGSSNQLICNSGTYQPNYGQSSCIDSSPGYYVSNSGQTTQSACVEGTYQPNYGQSSCIDSSPGYYVDNTALSNQTACPGGTFNPNHGSVSSNDCIITSPGYYSSSGSGSQNPCQGGTYQSLAGQTNCTSTDPGYYVPGISYAFQISCNPGTYQPNSGSSDCLIADAGYYVDSYSSVTQTACPAGTFNPINGSSTYSSCIDTSPGYFTPVSGMSEEYPCNPGTYQPLGGQDNCTNSSPGHFVPMNASTTQEPCIIGMYQPNYGRTYCEYPSSGYYVPTSSSSNQTRAEPGHYANANDDDTTTSHPCPLGYYQPYSGQSECIEADSGFYVDDNGSLEQIPCIGGTYNPNNGSISSDSCIDSIPGHYSKDGYSIYIPCELGFYQPNSGQSSCIESEPGFYVENNGSIDQIPCIEGTYNPNFGADSQDYCVQSNPGYHVPSPGSANQIPCIKGTYQPNFGESNCIPASLGYYVPVEGSISQIAADLDYYVDYTGSFTTSQCPEFYLTLETGSKTIDECLLDTDLDRNPNIFDEDDDNDNVLDVNDFCPAGQIDWISGFVNDQDIDGCKDSGEDLDDDNDGRLDENDAFPSDSFEQDDNDLDGQGDNLDIDDDNDGLSDILEYDLGTNQFDADTDGDGFNDKIDHFPLDGNEWVDTDGDGVGDNSDFMIEFARYQSKLDVTIDLIAVIIIILSLTVLYRKKTQSIG